MKFCKIDECTNKQRARGYCNKHYRRWLNYGDPLYPVRPRGRTGCEVENCQGKHYSQGFCNKHYNRWRRNGDPLFLKYSERIQKRG